MPDYNLSYVGTEANPWESPFWIVHDGRDFSTDIRYSVYGPHMSFGAENKATYVYKFNIDYPSFSNSTIKRIILGILGYSTAIGNQPNLKRTMPIRDPDGMGMVAERIVSVTYQGTSGYHPILQELYGKPPFASEFFSPTPFDRSFPDEGQKSANLYTYVLIAVEFCHPLYRVLSDESLDTFSEKGRFMFVQETPSTEYVQVPRGQIFWTEGPNNNTVAADGGNLVRMIQTISVHWHRIPWDAMDTLTSTWKSMLGTVNSDQLQLPVYNTVLTYDEETMLFLPYRTKPRLSPHGFLEFDAELNWAWRGGTFGGTNVTWNKFLHPNGSYYGVGWDNGGNKVKVYNPTAHDVFWVV